MCTNTEFRRDSGTEPSWDDNTLWSDEGSGQTGGECITVEERLHALKMKRSTEALSRYPDEHLFVMQVQTDLLLVADPVRRLQTLLQKGEAQFVDGRFVEIVLHKAVKKKKKAQVKVINCPTVFKCSLKTLSESFGST